MAKKVAAIVKLQIPGGRATAAPPVGPSLAPHGVNLAEFVKRFNSKTADQNGEITPVIVTIFEDKSFDFQIKTTPAAILIRKAVGLAKGSSVPNKDKVGKITAAQLKEIAQFKMKDLNAASVEAAMSMIAGTARSMGVEVAE